MRKIICKQRQQSKSEQRKSLNTEPRQHMHSNARIVNDWDDSNPITSNKMHTNCIQKAESLLSPPLQSPQAGGGRATCGLSCTQSRPPSDPRLSRSTLPPFSAGKVRRCSRLLCACLLTPGFASRGLSYRTALTGKEQAHSCCPFGFCFSFPVLLLVLRHGSA